MSADELYIWKVVYRRWRIGYDNLNNVEESWTIAKDPKRARDNIRKHYKSSGSEIEITDISGGWGIVGVPGNLITCLMKPRRETKQGRSITV